MTQKEFEERTGLKLNAEGYAEVEQIYMKQTLIKICFVNYGLRILQH